MYILCLQGILDGVCIDYINLLPSQVHRDIHQVGYKNHGLKQSINQVFTIQYICTLKFQKETLHGQQHPQVSIFLPFRTFRAEVPYFKKRSQHCLLTHPNCSLLYNEDSHIMDQSIQIHIDKSRVHLNTTRADNPLGFDIYHKVHPSNHGHI